jgi:nitroimidazol reductase NimA-like FMN-containing flavoprotein (pyridoxamine 5'-phosphate oxidase superfamily)
LEKLNITNRTKVNRLPKRAVYDKETIHNILDETFICHVGFKIEGRVYIIPTAFGRKDDYIFIHGSKNSRMLNSIKTGEDVCISVILADGLVLARSAFHHSVNYRSVIIFSKGIEIIEPDKKTEALKVILEHIMPGRWDDVRCPNQKELNATSVFSFKLDEASAKIRTGPPIDDEEDLDLNVWAGILPLKVVPNEPVKDEGLNKGILTPDYIINYKKSRNN